MQFPVYFENLITELSRLPGIGRKTTLKDTERGEMILLLVSHLKT